MSISSAQSKDYQIAVQGSQGSESLSISSRVKILKRKSFLPVKLKTAASENEMFTDEIGQFIVDTYGRKLYVKEGDDKYYQLNEIGVLVKVCDDEDKVYFYDRCGRYHLDERHERVYKASPSASEYMLDGLGNMCKTMEVVDGVEYRYNEYGRYVLTADGERVYRDECGNELEEDGLGNLVKPLHARPHPEVCEEELLLRGESEYLKKNIGRALRDCLAKTVVMQPSNPIKYLAELLRNYRNMLIEKERRNKEEIEMLAERDNRMAAEREELERLRRLQLEQNMADQYGEDGSVDTNLLHYETYV